MEPNDVTRDILDRLSDIEAGRSNLVERVGTIEEEIKLIENALLSLNKNNDVIFKAIDELEKANIMIDDSITEHETNISNILSRINRLLKGDE